MKVPKNFYQVTVDQYQRILPIYQKIEKETDTEVILTDWCRVISILTNTRPDQIESLPIDQLKVIIKSLNWLVNGSITSSKRKYLLIKGKLYKAKVNAKEFNVAQYVEIKTFLGRGNWVNEMHRILASIYSPLTIKGFKHDGIGHEKRAEIFKQISVGRVYPTVFFYSIQFQNLIKNIQEYGIRRAEEMNMKAEEDLMLILRETLENIGGGIVPSTK
jgi:hypothetical protein